MKSKKSIRSAFHLLASSAALTQLSYSQTIEINPSGAIPSAYTLAQAWNWDTDGNLESWAGNAGGFTLDAGTPIGGIITGTAASNDPNFTSPVTTIPTPYRVIIEMRIKKDVTDTTRIDLFWDDLIGGFGGGRTLTIPSTTFVPNGEFKTVRISFPFNRISGQLDRLRLDLISDAAGIGKVASIDYLRVYTETLAPLEWDADAATPSAQGGTGTWDELTNNLWWDGTNNVTWTNAGKRAVIGGTAGVLTVANEGVNANVLDFTVPGYTVTGGPINIGSTFAVIKATAATTRINSALTGSALLTVQGLGTNPSVVLGGINTGLSGGVTQAIQFLGLTNNNAAGTGTLTVGAGGNTFIAALDGNRTLANNVSFAGNRMIIHNGDLGTGLTVGNLIIDGNLALNCTSPADLFLRRALTVNGVVSGSNTNIGLYLAGDANILRLNNTSNTFTGGVRWDNGSTLEVAGNGSLGAVANNLRFNLGTAGTLRLLSAFDSARPIVIANNVAGAAGVNTTTGRIDTNGFDSTWTGTISAPVFAAPATAQQITNFSKIGAGTLTLNPGGITPNNLRSGGLRVDGGTLKIASGAFITTGSTLNGVYGNGVLEINGGSLSTDNFAIGRSAGTATFTLNTGGTYTNNLEFLIGFTLGSGIANINGGLADLNQFSMVNEPGLTSTMNLNGGEVRLNFFNARANIEGSPATANINFNGSLVKAKSTNIDFIETNTNTLITAKVQAGGLLFDSSGFAITIKQPLIHDSDLGSTPDGGLTKSGLGTLTLNAANTYTGPTTVAAGVLAVNGNSLANSGRLDITSGQVLIPASTNEVVSTLFYNGVEQPPGVYGSVLSGAANPSDTYFEPTGTGTLTVTGPGGGNSYADWLTANSPATGFTTDTDNDGIPNGVENVLGSNPNAASVGLTQVSATANSVTFQHTLNPTLASDVTYVYQWSSDLTEWFASGVANTAGTIGTIVASAPESGVVTVTTTTSGTASAKMFTRIKADNP
jgi:autotransporter-associated beta strand protein